MVFFWPTDSKNIVEDLRVTDEIILWNVDILQKFSAVV